MLCDGVCDRVRVYVFRSIVLLCTCVCVVCQCCVHMNASPPRSSLARKRHRWNRKKEGVSHEHDTTHTPMKASFYLILLVYLWTVWARISADLRLSFLRITRTRSMCSFHIHITFKERGQRKEGKQRRGGGGGKHREL